MIPHVIRRTVLAGVALTAVLGGAVLVAGSSRSAHGAAPGAATTAAPTAASAPVPPDLAAAFGDLATAARVTDPTQLAALAAIRAELHRHRPDLRLSEPIAWRLGTAGDADYAAASLGPDRLCLVGFRHDGKGLRGPACAAPAAAESPASPLAIYGALERSHGGIAVLAPAGTRAVELRTERGSVVAPIRAGLAYAASRTPAAALVVTADDGSAVRTPLAADSVNAFLLPVQEGVRRDLIGRATSDLDAALQDAAGFGGLSIDHYADHAIQVGITQSATPEQQAQVRAIVARFPKAAADVGYLTMLASTAELEQLQEDVLAAWGSAPGFVSIGLGFGIIDVVHLTADPLPATVQAIIDRHPQLFTVEDTPTGARAD